MRAIPAFLMSVTCTTACAANGPPPALGVVPVDAAVDGAPDAAATDGPVPEVATIDADHHADAPGAATSDAEGPCCREAGPGEHDATPRCTLGAIASHALMAAHRSAPQCPGFVLSVHRGGTLGAGGYKAAGTESFRIASVTKTFTAAAVLRLVEEGQLRLDQPLSSSLSRATVDVLAADGYAVSEITLRHLLLHQGGLYDFGTDPAYQAKVQSDPSHRWTRQEQVVFAMDHGAPLAAPGTLFSYSDTGYVLLGEAVELATGKGLAAALRALLRFDELKLSTTYLESLEPEPSRATPRAPQTYGGLPLTSLDPSEDLYGGGGLISNTVDLSIFYRGLFTGKVFRSPESLGIMTTVPAPNVAAGAAMGLFRADVQGIECWAHQGFWGVRVTYCPSIDAGLAVAGFDVTTLSGTLRTLSDETVLALARLEGCTR